MRYNRKKLRQNLTICKQSKKDTYSVQIFRIYKGENKFSINICVCIYRYTINALYIDKERSMHIEI